MKVVSIRNLVEIVVGPENLGNIAPQIIDKNFPDAGHVNVDESGLELASIIKGETAEGLIDRLVSESFELEGIGSLAFYSAKHPEEIRDTCAIMALSPDSHYKGLVPYVYTGKDGRGYYFRLCSIKRQLPNTFRVLVRVKK